MSDDLFDNYRGKVIANADPEQRGRCILQVDEVLGQGIYTEWAEPEGVQAGPGGNVGKCDVPPTGVTVWVRFKDGNVNRPIYSRNGWSPNPAAPYHLPNRALGKDQGVTKGDDSFTNANDATINEPADPFAAVYPSNRAFQTESGHIIEYDDTPGNERIHIYHKSGSFQETHPDGTVVVRTVLQKYEIIIGDDNLHIKGTKNVTIEGDLNEYVKGNVHRKIDGNVTEDITGSYIKNVDKTNTTNANGQITENSNTGIANNSGNNTHN